MKNCEFLSFFCFREGARGVGKVMGGLCGYRCKLNGGNNKAKERGGRLPCSSLLATLSAVFSDWRALLRSSSKTSNGLLPPANAEVDTLSDFLAVSSRRSSSSSSSTVDDRCGNSIDFKILPLNFREKRIRISTSTSSFTHTHTQREKKGLDLG